MTLALAPEVFDAWLARDGFSVTSYSHEVMSALPPMNMSTEIRP